MLPAARPRPGGGAVGRERGLERLALRVGDELLLTLLLTQRRRRRCPHRSPVFATRAVSRRKGFRCLLLRRVRVQGSDTPRPGCCGPNPYATRRRLGVRRGEVHQVEDASTTRFDGRSENYPLMQEIPSALNGGIDRRAHIHLVHAVRVGDGQQHETGASAQERPCATAGSARSERNT